MGMKLFWTVVVQYKHVTYTCRIHRVVPVYVKVSAFFYKFMLRDCVSHTHLNLSILSCTVCVQTKRHLKRFDVHLEETQHL
jgi:hypothetical protein